MHSRRALLGAAGGLAAGAVGGCLERPPPTGGLERAYGAFLALADWTRAVGGGELSVSLPTAVGETGHGWSPRPGLVADVADTDAFVYVDTPEFRWAQDLATAIERDYEGVAVIDAFDGIEHELLEPGADDDGGADRAPPTATVDAVSLTARARGETRLEHHDGGWRGDLDPVPVGSVRGIGVLAHAADGRRIPVGDDLVVRAESRDESVLTAASRGDHLALWGHAPGETEIDLVLERDGAVVWRAAGSVRASVAEGVSAGAATAFHDPHAWVDPVLAQAMVGTIADGLATADPDGEAAYRSRAATCRETIAAVDEEFAALASAADRPEVVLAGHNAFRYLEHRYGFEVHSPTGGTPDAEPAPEAVRELARVVDDAGIDTILYDPLRTHDRDGEVPAAVDVLLESSDAEDYAPVTALDGRTAAWRENGWGWTELMREVNLPSLAAALGVDSW